MMYQMMMFSRCILLVSATSLLASCMVGNSTLEMDSSVTSDNSDKIVKGVTNRSHILDTFGPPHAIARKGKTIYIPFWEGSTSREVDSDVLFELFSDNNKLTDQHIIYYYDNTTISRSNVFVLIGHSRSASVKSHRLWIMINDITGIVEDYVYRVTE